MTWTFSMVIPVCVMYYQTFDNLLLPHLAQVFYCYTHSHFISIAQDSSVALCSWRWLRTIHLHPSAAIWLHNAIQWLFLPYSAQIVALDSCIHTVANVKPSSPFKQRLGAIVYSTGTSFLTPLTGTLVWAVSLRGLLFMHIERHRQVLKRNYSFEREIPANH